MARRRVHRERSSLCLALIAVLLWVTLLNGAVLPAEKQPASSQGYAHPGPSTNSAMQAFFDQLDNNSDGQLQQQELHAAAVSLGSADATAAATAMISKLDSVDSGLDVSMTELDQHLHQILKVALVHAVQQLTKLMNSIIVFSFVCLCSACSAAWLSVRFATSPHNKFCKA